jgi:PAS domain S-box-containing protein
MRTRNQVGDAGTETVSTLELAELLDAAPEVFGWLRLDGTIAYVSAAAQEMFGRSPAELVGTYGPALFETTDRPEIERKLAALAAGPLGGVERVTARVVRPDGSPIWVDAAARLAEDRRTGERGFAAVAREAGEKVETERSLNRVEERFREMIELLPVVVYEAEPGPDGRFLYVSPQIEGLLGYSSEEWTADPLIWASRLHPDDRNRTFATEVEQAELGRDTDAHLASEYRLLHRGGNIVWVRDVARLCTPESGPAFWRGVMLDIGPERAAQRTLADAYERHRGIVEGLPACAYRAVPGNGGGWLFVSGHVEKLLGYRPQELIADPTLWRASLHADDRERIMAEEERFATMPAGSELTTEYRLRRRTGETVWVRDRAVLVEEADGRLVSDGIITDISAERTFKEATGSVVDVYRLTCANCGRVWASERFERCPDCEVGQVEAVSLNAALGDLAASRRQVEGLLDGIHKHLEALGTNLRAGAASIGMDPAAGDPATPKG